MQQQLEKELQLTSATLQIATISWEGLGERPKYSRFSLYQRLSENHSPIRIGNLATPEMLPRPRSVGFLPPGRSIRLFPIEKPLRVLYCFYDADFVESITEISSERWQKHTDELVTIKNQRLEILMQEIYGELEQPDVGQRQMIESVCTMMLVELGRHLRKLERQGARHGEALPLASWQLGRIQERIQASPELGYPGLSELAELCGVSQSHLARAFKSTTGWQIHKFIAGERLKTAKSLLAESQLSCEEIAARLGFSSAGYFSTSFRRSTGRTPTEFRRRIQKNSA